jgi:hypothetical protein
MKIHVWEETKPSPRDVELPPWAWPTNLADLLFIPIGEATELDFEDGWRQWDLAVKLRT